MKRPAWNESLWESNKLVTPPCLLKKKILFSVQLHAIGKCVCAYVIESERCGRLTAVELVNLHLLLLAPCTPWVCDLQCDCRVLSYLLVCCYGQVKLWCTSKYDPVSCWKSHKTSLPWMAGWRLRVRQLFFSWFIILTLRQMWKNEGQHCQTLCW